MRTAAAGLLAALALAIPAAAEPAAWQADGAKVQWEIRVPGSPAGWVNAITELPDGTFLASGFTGRDDLAEGEDWQAFTLRFDGSGRTLSTHRYGVGSGTDALWDVERGMDGGFVGVGFTDRIGAGGLDGWIVRLDADGSLLGETALGGPGYDRLTDIAPVVAGGFIAAGFTTVEGLGREFLVVRLDASGKEMWRRTYGGPGDQTALYIEPTGDGGFVAAGGGPGGATIVDDGDILVLRVSADGDELWRRTIGDKAGSEIPHNLHILADGRIRMTGYTDVMGAGGTRDALAVTLSPGGNLLHAEHLKGPGEERAMVSGLDGQGREWVTGYATAVIRDGEGQGPWDIFLTRVDAAGRFEGPAISFDAGGDEHGTVVFPLPDGGALIGGYAGPAGAGGEDPIILRIAPPDWDIAPMWTSSAFPSLKPAG